MRAPSNSCSEPFLETIVFWNAPIAKSRWAFTPKKIDLSRYKVRDVLNRVGGEVLLPRPPGKPAHRHKTQHEHQYFDPTVAQHG